MTKSEAYDQSRQEFYRLRLKEDIERRVAAEEAEATGANFGPRHLDMGMEGENQQFERWKKWAQQAAQIMEQRKAALSGAPEIMEEQTVPLEETEEEAPAAAA